MKKTSLCFGKLDTGVFVLEIVLQEIRCFFIAGSPVCAVFPVEEAFVTVEFEEDFSRIDIVDVAFPEVFERAVFIDRIVGVGFG